MVLEWDGYGKAKRYSISHRKYWGDLLNEWNLDSPSATDECKVTRWNRKFRIVEENFSGSSKFRTRSQYNVYTDGSKIGNMTGSGVAIYRGPFLAEVLTYRLPGESTVFFAELEAIKQCALHLTQNKDKYNDLRFVKIFVDSQAALLALKSTHITSLQVLSTIDALDGLGEWALSVSLVWIKAHAGKEGNELADKLAKDGTALPNTKILTLPTPMVFIKQQVKEKATIRWETNWSDYGEARQTKQFFPKLKPRCSRELMKLGRQHLGRITGLICSTTT